MMKNLFTNLMNWMMGSEMSKVVHEPAGSTTIAESPRNNPLITPLSPPNHPLLEGIWKHVACMLCVLMLGVGQMWGAISKQDMPSSTFTCGTTSGYATYFYTFSTNAANSDTIVFSAYDSYNSSITWASYTGGNGSTSTSWKDKIYAAASGTSEVDRNGTPTGLGHKVYNSGNVYYVRSTRTLRYLVTNCTGAMISGYISNSKTLYLKAYLVTNGTPSGTAAQSATITNSSQTTASISGLTASNTYLIEISGKDDNNHHMVCEVAFIYPHAGGGAPTTYAVTYNGNGKTGGSVPTDASSPYSTDATVTVLGNTGSLVKTNYVFTGWNTAADGSGTHYDAGDTFTMGTSAVTLYAEWALDLTLHTPGKYTTAQGSGGYGASLNTYNSRDYEVYYVSYNSSKLSICAGNLAYNASGHYNVIDNVSTSTDVTYFASDGWFAIAANSYGNSGTVNTGQFNVNASRHKASLRESNKITLRVSGYDQFAFYGKDYNAGSGNANQLVVKIDGVTQSYTHSTTDNTIFSFDITTGEHTIQISTAGGSNDNRVGGFSLRIPAAACTAPSSVSVDATNANGWRYSIGETIDLTCTATGGTGTKTYQWQKYIGSSWEDIDGATNARFQKASCTSSDGGSYRCVVSTGATCSLASDGYFIRVFTLNGNYSGSGFTENAIVWTGANTGVATVNLNASSKYEFKVYDNDGKIFGNGENNYIIQPVSWNCGTGNSNCNLYTGPAGNYTFTIDISHAQDGSPYVNVQVGYPSVSHPDAGYMYITKWWGTCYVHYWEGTNNALSTWGSDPALNSDRYVEICGTNYWYFPVIATYNKFIAKDAAGDPSNTTGDQVSTDHGGKYITHDGSWGWHDFATYTISFNNGGGTGSMSSISDLCPDADQALPANTFTKEDYIFTGWHADVATKVGGSTIAAGGDIADEATLQDINNNITLTAQWIACSGPSITVEAGMAGQTYTVGDVATAMTVTASAGNGGTLHYHWYQYNVGQNPLTQSVDAVGGTDANTYTPSTASAHEGQIFYCVVSEEGCSTTAKSSNSGAITVNGVVDPCSEPSKVANEIARFFVPCGLSNATSDSPTAWTVINEDASTGDNTFTTSGFGGGSSNWYRNETSGLIYGKLSGNSSYITIKLKSGNFQAGDVITAYFNRNNATKTGLTLHTQGSSYAIDPASTAAEVETSGTYTLEADAIEADGSIKLFRANSSTYVNRIIVTRAPVGASITATKTSPDYVTTDPGNVQLSISTTGASSGWYYRVKNTGNGGYQTPDNTPYNTATWTMTSGLSLGVNNFVVELYNGSGVLQATSGTITVTAETAYPITIAAGAGGSVSPSGEIKANESGNHIHPTITATPSSGYHFVNWTLSNANATVADASSATTTISNAVGACTITANFEEDAVLTLTAIEADVLYQAQDMANITFTTDTWFTGLSTNSRFETYGNGSSNSAKGTSISSTNVTDDISTKSFTSKLYIMTADNRDNTSDPTHGAIEFITPSSAGVLYVYLEQTNSGLTLKKKGTSTSTSLSGANYKVMAVDANTHYFINGAGSNRGLYGIKYVSTYSVSITPTNVTKVTGAIGATAAIPGKAYTATFTANVGYTLPSDATVTIGGTLQTKGTGYTWTISDGTATLTIPAANVTGNITIAVTGDLAPTYSITYNCNGAESGCPSNVAAATNLPNPLPSAPTKDGYDFGGWYTDAECTAAAVAGAALTANTTLYAKWTEHIASECITITNFEASQHNNSSNKPDSQGKYIYGYKTTVDAEHAVTITTSNTNNKGQNSNADMLVQYGTSIYIYADNTTTGGTPATFSNVISVSLKIKNKHATDKSNFTIKVGSTTIANAVSLSDANNSTYTTYTYNNLGQLSGKIEIHNGGSGSTNFNFFVDDIEICTADMTACTTPIIPSLSDQALCEGANATAWDATQTAVLADGETVSYQWQLKNGSNWDDISGATSASYDVSDAVTEAMAGTYRVVATVSKAGYTSSSATREVTLSVTESTEVTGITADKATVYPGNSVTLTATANTTVTWQWYTCTNAEGAGESSISGATSAAYTIASAPAAGTYYYKAKGTSSCGTAEYVYTLTVSAASECENYYWFIYADDATNNGVINNRDGFFSNTTTGTGNTGTYTMTVDGTVMTGTKRLSTGAYKPKFTVPTGATATLYIYGKAASSDAGKHLVLKRTSDDAEVEVTSNTTVQAYTKENIEAGEWTLSCGSSNWCYSFFAVKVCSASSCADATPTATATNAVVCSGTELSITATGYEESPESIQWQKLNSSTSTWDNISGATSATYTVASAAAANAGSYRVVVTKECARTSNTVTIAVPSAPVFGDVPASVSIMQTLALSISTVEATDAVKYRWYKSADATWDAGDTEIGTNKELIKAYDSEAIGSPSYYIFCRAQNACGITTSSAIAVNVTTYIEEDCATKGNEGEAQFGFENTSCSQGTYSSESAWYTNSRTKYLTYTAPEGKYFDEAKVRIAVSSGSKCGYAYSTDGGANWTYAEKTGLSSDLADVTIDLTGNVNAFRIGRNLQDGSSKDWGVTSGNFYLTKACFTYINACTATTVTPSTSSVNYEIGGAWSNPTFSLSPAAVSGGTLTYSSSNEDIASVDDEGAVTFNGDAGTVTITASYAGGTVAAVDYCASEGYYTITVSCLGGAPKVVVDGSVNMSGCNSSVTLHAKQQNDDAFADGTYQWFRNGTEIDGATSSSYTTTQAGTYTVERTNAGGCTTPSTNSVVITSETTEPEVERLVPFQYYHVDTIYLENSIMRFRHLFAVKNSGKLDGKSFKLYVSRNGGAVTEVTNSNALAIWTNADGRVDTVMIDLNKLNGKYSENDELVFTCKAIDCEGNVSEVYKANITMYVIGSKPTLALICSGSDKASGTRKTGELTVGGDFLTGYNKADLCQQTGNTSFDASTEWGLYTRLKANYIVTPVNGYAIFNKLNYEPFDILLLTDYPKASKSDAAATVLDDMADLVDFRPMLSLKAHMVYKSPSKWAAKGFTTAPVHVTSGDGRIYMDIVCYAHPMFDGIKEAGDHIFRDHDDNSEIVYEVLTEPGYENSKGLQGFEIDAAENFVTIGLIHTNATATENSPSTGELSWTPALKDGKSLDRMLVAAVERQTNPEARLVVLAVNCGAQSKFTETGRTIVHRCLSYLLTDATITPVADCSFTFDNGAGATHDAAWYQNPENCPGCTGTLGDGKWSTAANWGPDRVSVPGPFTSVRIAAPATVDIPDAHAMEARIVEGGSIEIPAGSALNVKSTIRRSDGSEISPTENSDIFIGSTASGNGTLIFNNNLGDTKATVAMYTTAKADIKNMSAATSTWQYIGTPHNDVAVAKYNYYDSWLYQYDTGTEDWTVIPNGGPLVPFRGYCVTHPEANHTFYMNGTLTATTSQEIAIPASKYVVVANSWVAPIDINAITDDDMDGITDKTVYFFNTGSDPEGDNETGTAAGTYRASPIHAASYTGDWQIPSMQGFYVVGGASDGTLHLDYERHVRPSDARSIVNNPMYAPRRSAENDEPEVAKLYFRGHRYYDRLIVLEREDFTRGYDSGWDGEAWGGNDAAPMSYVSTEGRWDAVSAIPEYEGTVIGFRAGEDSEYTIDFVYSPESEPLYLLDTENNTYTQVITGNAYHFTTGDKASHERFVLTRKSPQITTGIDNVQSGNVQGTRARKILIEDKMYILINGMLYDATGKVVK